MSDRVAAPSPEDDPKFFRRIVELAQEGVWVIDEEWRTLFVNAAVERMLGYRAEELLGRRVIELVPEELRDLAIADLKRHRAVSEQVEAQFRRKDGSTLHALLSASRICDDDGVPVAGLAVVTDITERRLAEEGLRAREAQLARAQALARCGSWEVDLTSNTVVWSDELFRMLAVEPAHLQQNPRLFFELVHADDRGMLEGATGRLFGGQDATYEVDHRMKTVDGRVIFVRSRAQLVRDATGRPLRLVGTGQDITERKHLEHQVAVAGRLASVGTLASGVAHEINNPLTYVIGNLELVGSKLDRLLEGGAPLTELPATMRSMRELVTEAALGADRVHQVVRDLKVFARAEDAVRVPVSLHDVLESSIRLAWNEIRHRARLVRDYAVVPPVLANESRLGQVFLNLLVNAAQAIPEAQADRHTIRVSTREDERGNVVIEVQDSGTGVPAEVLPRIFDPFFTTKPAGTGLGLGLSICHALVSSLGGRIECDSVVGSGTTMRVVLPSASGPTIDVTPAARAPDGGDRLPRDLVQTIEHAATRAVPPGEARGARVLVVDDEPMMVEFFHNMLAPEYEVRGTTRASEALALLTSVERFDLIICDVMMPEMSGVELYEQIRRLAPWYVSRLLFTTGGAFTPRARAFLDQLETPWLQKPFKMNELRAAMAAIMD